MPTETEVRHRSNRALLRALLPWLRPHRGRLMTAGALVLASIALFQCGPLLVRRAVDVDIARTDLHGLYFTVALFLGVQVASAAVNYVQRVVLERIGLDVVTAIKQQLFAHALDLSLSFHDRRPAGHLMSRVESDAEALRQMFAFTATSIFRDALKVAAGFVVMLFVQPLLTAIVAGVLLFLLVLTAVFDRLGRPVFRLARERNADVMSFMEERLHAVALLQAMRQEDAACAQMAERGRGKMNADAHGYFLWNTFFNLLMLVETGGLCLALWSGVSLAGVTMGVLLMFMDYLRRFFEPLFHLSTQVNVLQRAFVAGERVLDLLEEQPEVRDADVPKAWDGLRVAIEFDHVTFAYGDGEPVLQDVSFRLPRGQRWALVGATGGGKSTIVSLLLRFYDPQNGTVRVDGIDLRDLRQQDLRRRCALVLQDVVIFPGALGDNISLRDAAVDVEQAARQAAVHDFIDALPQRYDTVLADRGANLSSGQRQLLSFARALARDPDILLLDEATAAIDPHTERAVQKALHELLSGRTALIVAHRLSTVRDCDRILVVDRGRIAEQGTHDELLALDGLYRRLHDEFAGDVADRSTVEAAP